MMMKAPDADHGSDTILNKNGAVLKQRRVLAP